MQSTDRYVAARTQTLLSRNRPSRCWMAASTFVQLREEKLDEAHFH